MANRLFLDFDGTLTDPRPRLYSLFCELEPECAWSFVDYWSIKRKRISQRDMLKRYFGYDEIRVTRFRQAWMEKIEEPERLAKDIPYPGVDAFLARCAERSSLYLVTARQRPERAHEQIRRLGWSGFFTKILVTGQQRPKADLVREAVSYAPADVLAGDTGEDIMAGKTLGIQTVAVSSGVLNEEILQSYQPNQLLQYVTELQLDRLGG